MLVTENDLKELQAVLAAIWKKVLKGEGRKGETEGTVFFRRLCNCTEQNFSSESLPFKERDAGQWSGASTLTDVKRRTVGRSVVGNISKFALLFGMRFVEHAS